MKLQESSRSRHRLLFLTIKSISGVVVVIVVSSSCSSSCSSSSSSSSSFFLSRLGYVVDVLPFVN